MATITSAGSGLWSAGATWVGGVAPADNDAVVIATGHVVEFDVDQSGFANGIDGITITGTLSLTRTTGTYYLKIKAAKTIGGAGTFDCGTSGSPIPFASKHTITGGAGWYIKGNDGAGMTMTVYAAEPAIKTVKLTLGESAGATVLSVDTSVIGDLWADGDTIRIDNVNKGAQSEERVIATGGRAAGTITITAGLTGAKLAGTVVSLITRNVVFIGVGASTTLMQGFTTDDKVTIAGGWFSGTYRLSTSGSYLTISGGTFTGWASVLYSENYVAISGGIFSGNTYVLNYGNTSSISGGEFSGIGNVAAGVTGLNISGGIFSGCNTIINNCVSLKISGGDFKSSGQAVQGCYGCEISSGSFLYNSQDIQNSNGIAILGGTFIHALNSGQAIYSCFGVVIFGGTFTGYSSGISTSSAIVKNALFSGNTYDIYNSVFTAFNCLLSSPNEVGTYTSFGKSVYSESIDHDQVAGAYKAWTKGGVTSSQASVLPTGYTTAMQTVLENAAVEGYWQKEYTVGAGASIQFTMNLRKAASMTYLPRCIIFNKAATDPFAGGAGLHTFTMTDSIDTWEAESWTYTNSTAADVTLVVRFQGMHATATFYSALVAEQINVDLTAALAKLTAIQAKTDNLPDDPADQSLLMAAIGSIEVDNAAIADAVMGSLVEGTITLAQAQQIMLASFDEVIAAMPVAAGSGTIAHTYTVTSSVDASPVAEVQVSVSTDPAGTNIVASGYTDSFGQVIFYLDPGTYYFWRSKDRWTFANPDTEVVA